MARVTVEDCVEKVPNRFELVLFAAHRARAMSTGAEILVERDNDKNPVVALREIADDQVNTEEVREEIIESFQHRVETDIDPAEVVTNAPTVQEVFGNTSPASPSEEAPAEAMAQNEEEILAALMAKSDAAEEDVSEKDDDSE